MCNALAARGARATLSLAGRVARPKRQALPMRSGGFGGVDGLCDHLCQTATTHVIDATHPFASQMSANAVAACAKLGLPLIALVRPPWVPEAGDKWQSVPDIDGAVAALDQPGTSVMLAIGRMHLADFAPHPQHHYLLRLVDPPEESIPLPKRTVVLDRGPFTVEGDLALMRRHDIQIIVSKNAGGTGAVSKIIAARQLGRPVIMIERPSVPQRQQVYTVESVLRWLADHGAYLGV